MSQKRKELWLIGSNVSSKSFIEYSCSEIVVDGGLTTYIAVAIYLLELGSSSVLASPKKNFHISDDCLPLFPFRSLLELAAVVVTVE